jgi:hypothetical protein
MGRPRTKQPKPEESVALSIRIGADLANALDSEVEKMNAEHRGLTFTRTDIVRVLLHEALDARAKSRKGR